MRARMITIAATLVAAACSGSGGAPAPDDPIPSTTASTSTTTSAPPTTSTTTLSPTQQAREDERRERDAMEAAAVQMWTAYNDAVRTRDGETAARNVTASTIEWFDEILSLAQEGDRADFEVAPFPQNIRAIDLRLGLGEDVLALQTGEEALAALIDLGTVLHYDTGEHELYANSEITVAVRRGVQTITTLIFEDGAWRFDLWRWDNTLGYYATLGPNPDITIMEFYTGLPLGLSEYLDLIDAMELLDPPSAG